MTPLRATESDVVTDLADLRDLGFDPAPGGALDEHVEVLLAQVEWPRVNLGGSGPPGRVD